MHEAVGEPTRGVVVLVPEARPEAGELTSAVGHDPAFVGDATATATVDALLPLWMALAKQNGGNRRLALRIVR